MSKILVTGGAGFIGSNIVDALVEGGHEVAVVDNLSTGRKENLNPKAKFYESDITATAQIEKIFTEFSPEAIYHLAAQISVRTSVEKPENDIKINLIGTVNLLVLCQKYEVKKFVYSSTGGAIYGDGSPLPTPETVWPHPESPYGLNKLASETYIEYFSNLAKFQAIRLRYANVYGPRQNPHGEAGVVAIFSEKMLKGETPVINGDGNQTRDYVFVGDVVQANLAALKYNGSGFYNIGVGREISVNELTEKLAQTIGYKGEIKHGPAKPGEQQRSSLDANKAFLELGFKPATTFEQGLKKTVAWYRQ